MTIIQRVFIAIAHFRKKTVEQIKIASVPSVGDDGVFQMMLSQLLAT